MLRTILWFIYFWIYMVAVTPMSLRVKSLKKKGKTEEADQLVSKCVYNWASRLLKAAGVTFITTGKENIPPGPCYFAANHQGNFDIPTMLTQLDKPNSIIAKKEMQKMPGIRTWMGYFDCIFLDRDNPRQQLKCLAEAQELLARGQSVCIFPEGTRSKGGPMGEFKAASLRPALKTGAPVVPVAIEGSYKAMEAQGIKIRPATIKVRILPPIETKDMDKEQAQKIGDTLKSVLETAVSEMRAEG